MREFFRNNIKNYKTARFTYIIIVYCLIIFLQLFFSINGHLVNDQLLTKFGAPPAIDIFSGKQWGLITNSFVHFEFGHLIINLFGTFLLATYIERRIGFWKLFLFGLAASFITSAFQLSFSSDAGIGLSGVNYSMFGFIYGKTFFDKKFKIPNQKVILFSMISFIILCELMNQLDLWNVATIALISGLIFGIITSLLISPYKRFGIISSLCVFSFAIMAVFYSPWSASWNCSKGIEFHEKGQQEFAKQFYEKARVIDPSSSCANDNLRLIRIDELSGQALQFHMRGNYLEASRVYDEILRIDPTNQWAKKNKQRLP